jgi:hypothetical protein
MSRRRRDRGAALIEAAIIMPVLILVVIVIMEYGLAFKDYLTVSYLSREGARIGAPAGDDLEADCAVLTGLGKLVTFTSTAPAPMGLPRGRFLLQPALSPRCQRGARSHRLRRRQPVVPDLPGIELGPRRSKQLGHQRRLDRCESDIRA